MTRKIKFRGLTLDGKGWAIGYFTTYDNRCYIKSVAHDQRFGCGIEVFNDTVGQFTGLLDANGTPIYEGDVIAGNDPDVHHVIVWVEGEAGFGCYRPPRQDWNRPSAGLRQTWIDEFSKTVIGNIFEHPELLEAK